MDVDKVSFYPLLRDILTDISEAHFVAIDLELSGVPSKGTHARVVDAKGKASLQQRYVEVKEAAERYQILQIGLTVVQEDTETGKYVCKPYNFDLSPIVETPGLDIERIFSYQSGAAEFLMRVGFDMSKPFTVGVPYLSRLETKQARAKHAKRQDKSSIADMQIKPTDTEALALLDRVRSKIAAWLTGWAAASQDYINVGPAGSADLPTDAPTPEFSRFEKRLVHQLVRAEYPELVTISKRGFIQIVRFDQEREDRIAADRKAELDAKIGQQKGFRWVIEALLGSNISGLDLKLCATDSITGAPVFADMTEYNAQFHRAQSLLRGCPRVLVGHNCFLDLVYIYRTFIGPLPNTVVEFQHELHKLWPLIVDTKYMATRGAGDIPPNSSLEEIAKQLEDYQLAQGKELDVVDELHRKYKDVEVFHEAGFDSLLTGQIAVRLSSKLEREGAYIEVEKISSDEEGAGQGGVELSEPDTTSLSKVAEKGRGMISAAMNKLSLNGTASSQATSGQQNGTTTEQTIGSTDDLIGLSPTDEITGSSSGSPSKLSAKANSFVPSSVGGKWKRRGDPTVPPTAGAEDPFVYDPKDLKHRHKNAVKPGIQGGMPRFDTDFWRVYGNKLRVFGTEEGVCVLQADEAEEMSDDA